MNEKERKDVSHALARWFQSQEVDAVTAAYVMMTLAGTIIGLEASSHAQLDRLIKHLVEELQRAGIASRDSNIRQRWWTNPRHE